MGVAYDQQVGMHRVQRHRRVDQRFALLDRAGLHGHVHHVRAQPLARDLEACLRAGRGLEEHVDLGQALQRATPCALTPFGIGIAVGEIEDCPDLLRVQGFDPQKMRLPEGHGPLSSPLACL
jgi:hypothetical protein